MSIKVMFPGRQDRNKDFHCGGRARRRGVRQFQPGDWESSVFHLKTLTTAI